MTGKPNTGRRTSAHSKQKMSRQQPKSEGRDQISSSEKTLEERLSDIKARLECFLNEDDVKKILDVVSQRPLWIGANGDRIANLLKLKYRFSEELAFDASLVIEQAAPISAVKVRPPKPSSLKKDESSSSSSEEDDDDEDDVDRSDHGSKTKPKVQNSRGEKSSSCESSSAEENTSDESDCSEEPKTKKAKAQMSADDVTPKMKDENCAASASANICNEDDDSDIFIIRNPSEITNSSVNENREHNKQPSSISRGSTTVVVKNIAWGLDETTVKEYFETTGDVKDVRLARQPSGRLKGFGHIEFFTEEAAKKACEKSGEMFYGREIDVQMATDWRKSSGTAKSGNGVDPSFGSQATAIITGFDKYLEENMIRTSLTDLLKDCGVKNVAIPKHEGSGNVKGIALIEFNDKRGLSKALKYDGSEFYGSLLTVHEVYSFESPGSARDWCGGGRGRGRGRGGRGYAGQK